MVIHILKSNPALCDREHVQVEGPGTAYLFFYDKQGRKGLVLEATHTLRAHVGDTCSEWISRFAHFMVNPIPLEGWGRTMAVAEWQWQCTRVEFQSPVVPSPVMSEYDSNPQLQGNASQPTGRPGSAEESTNMREARTVSIKQRGRPPKKQPMGVEVVHHPPPLTMVGLTPTDFPPPGRWWEVDRGIGGRGMRSTWPPTCLDMPIFKTIDPNAHVTYTIWKFEKVGSTNMTR